MQDIYRHEYKVIKNNYNFRQKVHNYPKESASETPDRSTAGRFQAEQTAIVFLANIFIFAVIFSLFKDHII